MDMNDMMKGLIAQYQPQVERGLGMAGMAAKRGLGLMAEDANRGAAVLNDPRNAWIGTSPVGRVGMEGLGLAGALLGQIGYHGTHRLFSEFNRLQEAKNRNAKQIDTLGSWFSSEPTTARQYGPIVMPTDLDMKKPLVFMGDGNQGGFKMLRDAVHREGGVEAFREKAKAEGYDGIHIIGDKLDHFDGDVFVAFDNEQIKHLPASTVPEMTRVVDEKGRYKYVKSQQRTTKE